MIMRVWRFHVAAKCFPTNPKESSVLQRTNGGTFHAPLIKQESMLDCFLRGPDICEIVTVYSHSLAKQMQLNTCNQFIVPSMMRNP